MRLNIYIIGNFIEHSIIFESSDIMKSKILNILIENKDTYISGEDIATYAGVSRTAVWKVISQLRKQGYDIKSQTKRGYMLTYVADDVTEPSIRVALDSNAYTEANRFLFKLLYFESVDSTNTRAKMLAEQDNPEGTLIIADEQTGGRGRLGRVWSSPKSTGLWMSLILRPNIEPSLASVITQIAVVAMTKAIIYITGLEVGIKWPNDIWIGSKKVCGILTEMSAEFSRVNYVVLGIGLNVNNEEFSDELSEIATSLKMELDDGRMIKRADIVANFLHEFKPLYDELLENGTFETALKYCRDYSITLNRDVNIIKSNTSIPAKAIDILGTGELLVLLEDGTEYRVNSGEVSIRNR